jgi:hypothetical protein
MPTFPKGFKKELSKYLSIHKDYELTLFMTQRFVVSKKYVIDGVDFTIDVNFQIIGESIVQNYVFLTFDNSNLDYLFIDFYPSKHTNITSIINNLEAIIPTIESNVTPLTTQLFPDLQSILHIFENQEAIEYKDKIHFQGVIHYNIIACLYMKLGNKSTAIKLIEEYIEYISRNIIRITNLCTSEEEILRDTKVWKQRLLVGIELKVNINNDNFNFNNCCNLIGLAESNV